MQRCSTDGGRVRVCVPDCFVVPPVTPKEPPPVPGTVKPEDLRPPVDPPLPFLCPWAPARKEPIAIKSTSSGVDATIPCEVDVAMLEEHTARHDVEDTVRAVFAGHPETVKESFIASTLASMSSPFASSPGDTTAIVWTLHSAVRKNPAAYIAASGGKKSTHRHDRILKGPSWSIVSYGEELRRDGVFAWPGIVRRNVIYDGNGDAVAQVDFGHGDHVGTHCHALVVGSLDHKPGSADDHMFPLRSVPWFWTCVPDVRSVTLQRRLERRRKEAVALCDDSTEDDSDASDFEDDGTTADADRRPAFISREDVVGGRYSASVFDRQRGAKRFGLADTQTLDDCGWAAVNLPFEDFGM